MVIVELKEMETSSGIYEEEDNIQIDFGEGTGFISKSGSKLPQYKGRKFCN